MGVARIEVGGDHRICAANEAAAELIGLSVDRLRALPVRDLEPPDADLANGVFAAAELPRLPMPVRGATTLRAADGRLLPVRFRALLREDGGYTALLMPRGAPIRTGPHAQAAEALGAWRAAERRLAAAEPGTLDHRLAAADVRVYRRAFHETVDRAMADAGEGLPD